MMTHDIRGRRTGMQVPKKNKSVWSPDNVKGFSDKQHVIPDVYNNKTCWTPHRPGTGFLPSF